MQSRQRRSKLRCHRLADGSQAHNEQGLASRPQVTRQARPHLNDSARRGPLHPAVSFLPTRFEPVISFVCHLLMMTPVPCPRLLLSATLVQEDIDACSGFFLGFCPNILQKEIDCRGIAFKIVISGDAVMSLKRDAPRLLRSHTHSRSGTRPCKPNAESNLRVSADDLLE